MLRRGLEALVFKVLAPRGIRHLAVVRDAEASGLAGAVFAQMKRDFQTAAPLTLHAPLPDLLAGVWAMVRESLIARPAPRVDREVVATAVSRLNACPFCVEAHHFMLDGAGQASLAKALWQDRAADISDPGLARLAGWAMATLSPGSSVLSERPFADRDAAQIVGTAVAFHYLNRVVNVFLDESPVPINPGGTVKRKAGGAVCARIVALAPLPGESISLLPESPLPPDLSWAAANPAVAGAFARMAAVAETAGVRALPGPVRELVEAEVRSWSGEPKGLSRTWTEPIVEALEPEQRPAGRLALLAAFASYQMSPDVIEAFRRGQPGDGELLGAVAWAAFTAARRIGSWL
jgi:AhpD family alkylhydroperoxidase